MRAALIVIPLMSSLGTMSLLAQDNVITEDLLQPTQEDTSYDSYETYQPAQSERVEDSRSKANQKSSQVQVPTQKILILNNQPQNSRSGASAENRQGSEIGVGQNQGLYSAQEQPMTHVEAAPLSASRADLLRKKRQEVEVHTENKIVEKLEDSRIQDETDRADRLFGERFHRAPDRNDKVEINQPVVVAPVAPPAPSQIVVVKEPAPPTPPPQEERTKQRQNDSETGVYVFGQAGIAEYPNAVNVEGNGAVGVAVGVDVSERLSVEGNFLFSRYDIRDGYWRNYDYFDDYDYYSLYKELDQYGFQAAIKYNLLPGRFKPYIGGAIGYTYRVYTDRDHSRYYGSDDDTASSNAFDAGVLIGGVVAINDSFGLGAEMKYMANLDYKTNSGILDDVYEDGNPLEKEDYYTLSVFGRFNF